MMALQSDRLKLPLLAAAQAQKEVTHNEALTLADIAVQAVVQSIAPATVPTTAQPGDCWIVGPSPAGAWSGHAGALAGWTAGGWRFLAPFEGMQVWSVSDGMTARRRAGNWEIGRVAGSAFLVGEHQVVGARQPKVQPVTGGGTVDAQARSALAAVVAGLEAHGLFSPV